MVETSEEEVDERPEMVILVLLRDQLQKLRISESNRADASARLEEHERAKLHASYAERLLDLEKEVTGKVKLLVRDHPAWPWLSEIRGVAETSASVVLGPIDIARADTVSALWRYAGYGVVDGHRERPVKGEKLSYNARLKTMVWRLIDLQIKSRGPYRKIYDDAKHTYLTTRASQKVRDAWLKKQGEEIDVEEGDNETDTDGGWTLGHCEAAARRKAAKMFLSHLWVIWRTAEGLPVSTPFIGNVPGHDIIDPWDFIREFNEAVISENPKRGKRAFQSEEPKHPERARIPEKSRQEKRAVVPKTSIKGKRAIQPKDSDGLERAPIQIYP